MAKFVKPLFNHLCGYNRSNLVRILCQPKFFRFLFKIILKDRGLAVFNGVYVWRMIRSKNELLLLLTLIWKMIRMFFTNLLIKWWRFNL